MLSIVRRLKIVPGDMSSSVASPQTNIYVYNVYKPVLYLENFQGTVNGTIRVGAHVRERPGVHVFSRGNQLFSTFTLTDVPFSLSQQSSPGIYSIYLPLVHINRVEIQTPTHTHTHALSSRIIQQQSRWTKDEDAINRWSDPSSHDPNISIVQRYTAFDIVHCTETSSS